MPARPANTHSIAASPPESLAADAATLIRKIAERMTNIMQNGLTIDRDNRKLLGVCAGLARSFGIDAIWVRLGFVASVLVGFGFPILLYFIIALLAD